MVVVLINSISIIIGSLIGLGFKKVIRAEIFTNITKVLGIIIIIIGISGILTSMLFIEDGVLKTRHELLFLVLMISGALFGELLKIDDHFNRFTAFLERKFGNKSFSQGFINASILYCVGTMAIIGSIQAASKNYQILFVKSALDGITSIILASTLGIGVIFSAIPVFIYQGLMTLFSYQFFQFDLSLAFMQVFNMVGYTLILCLGLNYFLQDKIKVINLLPSLLLVIGYFLLTSLF